MADISKELANLERIGKLTPESGTRGEIAGLLTSGAERLADARRGRVAREQSMLASVEVRPRLV